MTTPRPRNSSPPGYAEAVWHNWFLPDSDLRYRATKSGENMRSDVTLLSIDGLGTKSLMAAVEDLCAAAGLFLTRVSWQGVMADAQRDGRLGEDSLNEPERLWLDHFRIFFADACVAGSLLHTPESEARFAELDIMGLLNRAEITSRRPVSPVGTGTLETASHTLLHDPVVRPLVAQESLGVKHITKSLLMTEYGMLDMAAEFAAGGYIQQNFGEALAPRLGNYLKEVPKLAAKVRVSQITVFDSSGPFDGQATRTFVELQSYCAAIFEEYAYAYGWAVVEISDISAVM